MTQNETLLLGIDIGTTGTKCAIYDLKGELVAHAYQEYSMIYPQPSWAEQDPHRWWNAVQTNLHNCFEQQGIDSSRIASIGSVEDVTPLTVSTADKPFPVVDDAVGETMRAEIAAAKAEGDSVGGIVECAVLGLPVGLGGPLFDGMEGRISSIVFGIPAVKGIEFGIGFGAARLRGSENNDPFVVENGTVRTTTNHCGGILGGITNGMPLTFRAAFKPTPSIAKEQQSVNLNTLTPEILRVRGRHDPCIVPRAVPCIEAAAAIAVYDALLGGN